MTDIYYESEFETKLLELIKQNYGLENNEIFYFVIRFMIVFNVLNFRDIKKDLFLKFILEDNNLDMNDIVYKKIVIANDSLENIIENWLFDLKKDNFDTAFIENTVKNILKESSSESSKFKKEPFYNDLIVFYSLNKLNQQFNVKQNSYYRMNDLYYGDYHNEFARFREEKLDAILKSFKTFEANPFSLIKEVDVENFLKNHLDLIYPDLKLIGTQYPIKDAIIDILAEDKNNEKVVIELKIKPNDTRLIWQALYYPLELTKELNQKVSKMIVIAPKLNDSIKEVLVQLNNIEYFEYAVSLSEEKINNIILTKVI